nr:MAG TPA: hypothetical protein [Caudoviricetes sp.]
MFWSIWRKNKTTEPAVGSTSPIALLHEVRYRTNLFMYYSVPP